MTDNSILISIMFYLCAAIIICGSLFALFINRIVYTLGFSVIVFLATGLLFLLLGAEYNAVVQIAVYGIAIPILLVFAIMFTPYYKDKSINLSFSPKFTLAVVSAILFVLTLFNIIFVSSTVLDWVFKKQASIVISRFDMFTALSNAIYSDYLQVLELFSFLLLIVVVGLSSLNLFKEDKRG